MSRLIRSGLLALALCALSALAVPPPEPPPLERPKPPPAQITSSEAVAPLPVPAVPLKRQEKKNPPVPPVLLTKVRSGDAEDWTRTPDDIKGLLEWVSAEMNVHFSPEIKPFTGISVDPAKNPVLYRSGYKSFVLTPAEVKILRQYILNGGTIIFNSLVGTPAAYQSALQAARDLMPERPAYRLRMDHPVFHSFYDIDKVAYRPRMIKDGMVIDAYPYMEGVDVDNRTAIFISRWDFSLGWEANPHDSWGYVDADARKLGGNIIAYVTAMRDAGHSVGKSVELVNSDQKTAGKFRVGQVIHDGPWQARSAAFPMLLNQFHATTGTPVSFELRNVQLSDSAIFEMPFLYLTGTTDFVLTGAERANLRRFLMNGGVLFAEAAEGRKSFDLSFRQEMAQVLPGRELRAIPQNHALFSEPQDVRTMKPRNALAVQRGNQTAIAPEIYGIELNGTLNVIYSPYDLSAGWERAIAPYALGYEPRDATALGVNVLFYVLAH